MVKAVEFKGIDGLGDQADETQFCETARVRLEIKSLIPCMAANVKHAWRAIRKLLRDVKVGRDEERRQAFVVKLLDAVTLSFDNDGDGHRGRLTYLGPPGVKSQIGRA